MTSVPSAADYLAAGLKLVAIPRGSKAPKDDGWQLEQNAIRNVEQANLLAGCNIGVAHLWSGTAAVDVDDYLAAVPWLAKRGIALDDHLAAADAVQISSGRPNRCKLWYRLPDGVIWLPTLNLRESYGVGLELRCAAKDGSATVVDVIPPSLHPTGRPYEWKGDWRNPPELPEELLTLWRGLAKNGTKKAAGHSEGGPIREGGRNNHLTSLAGTMRRRGMSEAAIAAALLVENSKRCVPPLPDAEVTSIAKSCSRYASGATQGEPPVESYDEDMRRESEEPGKGNGKAGGEKELEEGVAEFGEDKLAAKFTELHGKDWRYVEGWGKWLMWTFSRWLIEGTRAALHLVRLICRDAASLAPAPHVADKLASRSTVSGVESLARSDRRHAMTTDDWDRDPYLLNVLKGTVELRAGVLREHRREDYITKIAAATPQGDCPGWMAFLDEITDGNLDYQGYLRRMAGYMLTAATIEHALFFAYGLGGNGKSVFAIVFSTIMGDYATTAPMNMFMETKHDRHPTDLAGLRGARLVLCNETADGCRWDESKIKTLTGGDRISARFMRQDFFQYTPQFKLLIIGNHKPFIRNVDEAIRRRLHLLPFAVAIPKSKQDPKLAEKLLLERDGVLAWAVNGCLEWQITGLKPPKCVVDATEEYLCEEDSIGQFLEEECAQSVGTKVAIADLYTRWRERAEFRGEYVGSAKWLVGQLVQRGFDRVRVLGGAKGLSGLCLKDSGKR